MRVAHCHEDHPKIPCENSIIFQLVDGPTSMIMKKTFVIDVIVSSVGRTCYPPVLPVNGAYAMREVPQVAKLDDLFSPFGRC